MTEEEARKLAEGHLAGGSPEVVIVEVMTRPYGWVFFYESKRYLETGDAGQVLVGNAPLLVERDTGKLITLGTGEPVESYFRNYELYGDPHRQAGRSLELLSGARERRIQAIRLLRQRLGLSLGDATSIVDGAISGRSSRMDVSSAAEAARLADELRAEGFECSHPLERR